MAPTRFLVAMVADWPVVAAGCRPDEPAAVVAANRVLAVTAAAREDGVIPGLRRREAQGRCPELSVMPADDGRDARAWEPVVAAVEALTRGVEVMGPGALALATRGPSRYFGGDVRLAEKVAGLVDEAAGQAGCQVGVADGLFAAGLAARLRDRGGTGGTGGTGRAGAIVVPPRSSRAWLAPHPVQVLGPDYERLTDLLVRLGLKTLGDLAGLPGPAVLGRFGPEGQSAHRLARGLDNRPFAARTPPPDLVVTAEMDPPEERVEAATFVTKALADQLLSRLGAVGLACTKVAIEVDTEHGERLVRHWRHEGSLTSTALAERTRWQLEGWLAGESRPTSGITMLRLIPEEVRPDEGRQLGFWGGSADSDSRAARALARVQGLLGPEGVMTAVLVGGRGFDDQVRLVPWGDARGEPDTSPSSGRSGGSGGSGRSGRSRSRKPVEQAAPWPGRLSHPSPAVVYQPPLPAEVRDAAGEAVVVAGRGALSSAPAAVSVEGARWEEVAAWAGPWPVEERWWDGDGGRRRARFQVLLAGGEAHLISRESRRWWVEATYG